VSNLLKRHYLKDEPDLAAQIPTMHCLFGTHLLTTTDFTEFTDTLTTNCTNYTNLAAQQDNNPFNLWSNKTVAVVESEKTAVIMSERYPECLWLATGGLNELTPQKLFPLRGRRIILFPDTDPEGKAYATWYRIMLQAQRLLGHPIHLSPLLEQHATPEQKARKIDIADLIRR
jgi:hypothetical protein